MASLAYVFRASSSVVAVARVQRLDGRSRVVAVYRGPESGWERVERPLVLTAETVERLRADGVRTVRVRRGIRVGRVPLVWFPVDAAMTPA